MKRAACGFAKRLAGHCEAASGGRHTECVCYFLPTFHQQRHGPGVDQVHAHAGAKNAHAHARLAQLRAQLKGVSVCPANP